MTSLKPRRGRALKMKFQRRFKGLRHRKWYQPIVPSFVRMPWHIRLSRRIDFSSASKESHLYKRDTIGQVHKESNIQQASVGHPNPFRSRSHCQIVDKWKGSEMAAWGTSWLGETSGGRGPVNLTPILNRPRHPHRKRGTRDAYKHCRCRRCGVLRWKRSRSARWRLLRRHVRDCPKSGGRGAVICMRKSKSTGAEHGQEKERGEVVVLEVRTVS